MMPQQQSTLLQPPKSGRSRFSKALPSVPGLHDAASTPTPKLPPTPKGLPQLPSLPLTQDDNTSLSSFPLPPLPTLQTPKTLPSIPPSGPLPPSAMVIPRRPVGKSAQIATPTPAPTSTTAVALPLAPIIRSPSESLSSLLSAYSRSSDDLVLPSSDEPESGGGSAHLHIRDFDADTAIAPATATAAHTPKAPSAAGVKLEPSPATHGYNIYDNEQSQPQSVTRKPITDRSLPLPPPPPPSKDEPSAQSPQSPQTQASTTDHRHIATPSPPRTQIWERRSVKGSRELPNLQLDYSHGSTADTQSTVNPDPAPAQAAASNQPPAASLKNSPLPPTPQPSAPAAGGLPGRDVRPRPPNKSTDESQTMGHGASKLKHLKDKLRSSHRSQGSSGSSKAENTQRSAAHRPPTPEYHKEDIKTPVLDTFVSPISPASSPEPSREVSPNTSKDLPEPPKQPSRSDSKPFARKAVPTNGQNLHPATSLPDFKNPTPSSANEPPVPIHSARRASPPNEAAAFTRGEEAVRSSTREGSVRPDPQRAAERQPRYPVSDSDPRLVRSDSRGTLYRGRTGTLYPEMKKLRDADPQAFFFPGQSKEPLPEGAIVKAVPLRDAHFNCFQRHRFMKRIVNRNCPLTCQTCQMEDSEDRWACSFCHLRICEPCSRALDVQKRDLRRFVNSLGPSAATLSLSSPSRPGSALGLHFTF